MLCCQMFFFKPKIPIWVNFGGLRLKILIYFMAIGNILWTFGIFYDIWYILCSFGTFCVHLVHFVLIWYILCSFGTFCVNLVHFVFIWYILCSFGTFSQIWYNAPRKIWQPWSGSVLLIT
jgi:hypothetical protein